jgi:hypothetical protein
LNALGRILSLLRFPSRPRVDTPPTLARAAVAHMKIGDGMAMVASGYRDLYEITDSEAFLLISQFSLDSAQGHLTISKNLREALADEMP